MNIIVIGKNDFIIKNLDVKLKELDNVILNVFDDIESIKEEQLLKVDNVILVDVDKNLDDDLRKFMDTKTPLIIINSNHKNQSYNSVKAHVFNLPEVFGKWDSAENNSIIFKLFKSISKGDKLNYIEEDKELTLVYIDDLVEKIIEVIVKHDDNNVDCIVEPIYQIKYKDAVSLIESFKTDMTSISVPETGNDLTKKLFSTYVSYLDISAMISIPKMNIDDRGSFTELIHTINSGQVSVSKSVPGAIRGNHYHNTKMERFIIVKGKARVSYRDVNSSEVSTFDIDDTELKIISIPVGYTHRIVNIGDDEMVMVLWCNEISDKSDPDTHFCLVD